MDYTLIEPITKFSPRKRRCFLDVGTADKLKTLVKEALEWMVEDGIAKTIECDVNIIDDKLFGGKTAVIEVVINKPDGEYENYNFEINWKATNGI